MLSRRSAESLTVAILLSACLSAALSVHAHGMAALQAPGQVRVVTLDPVTVVALRTPATPR